MCIAQCKSKCIKALSLEHKLLASENTFFLNGALGCKSKFCSLDQHKAVYAFQQLRLVTCVLRHGLMNKAPLAVKRQHCPEK